LEEDRQRRSKAWQATPARLSRARGWLLALVATEPDLTLEEIRARLRSQKKMKVAIKFDLEVAVPLMR